MAGEVLRGDDFVVRLFASHGSECVRCGDLLAAESYCKLGVVGVQSSREEGLFRQEMCLVKRLI